MARSSRAMEVAAPFTSRVSNMELSLMNTKCMLTLASALVVTAVVATDTLGGTNPLAASGSKRRVNAVVETTTNIVSAPVVEKKIENTETWVAEPTESVATAIDIAVESPIRPWIPVIAALTSTDCDGDGTSDAVEIAAGAMDWDNDGVLDSCEYALGDLNLNGIIDGQDVSILLGWWGIPNPLFGDINGDNIVNARDLGMLLGRFGVVTY